MTEDTAHNQIKPYCDINEALEWIAFGWPAFENRADRIPFERKQRFDGKTFRFAEKQLKQAIENRNIEITGIPCERCSVVCLPFVCAFYCFAFLLEIVLIKPVCFLAKLFHHPVTALTYFTGEKPSPKIPRLYVPIERFFKYTFSGLPFCPELDAWAAEIPESERAKRRIELRDKEFESAFRAKHFAQRMKLPLPERQSNRRMIRENEHVSALHPKWNALTFSTCGVFLNGLSRIEIPTDQLQVLFPLALTQTENKSFSETLEELDYVSPYMLVMKDVIEELKISKTNQPVKKIVEHAVIESGNKRNIEISQRFAEYIAQAIRLPEAQKGGAPKLPETKK